MKAENLHISYGSSELEITIRRRERSTLEIAVEPDTSVVVTAPPTASMDAIAAKVRKRAGWIWRQQRFFAQFLPRTPARQFVPGETHLYLGRQYRLKVMMGLESSVRLKRGFLEVHSHYPDRPEVTEELLRGWYRSKAKLKFEERLGCCLRLFGDGSNLEPTSLTVRQVSQRWGSMSPAGRLLLNLRLIEAPVDAIDYVITHELCHLKEPNHGPRFHQLLSQHMPDWERRKALLERVMA